MNGRLMSFRARTLFALLIMLLVPFNASAHQPTDLRARVEPLVYQQITRQGEATFWVVLREKADLNPAYHMNWNARGHFVYNRLRAVANASQAGLISLLKARQAKHKPFWIVNAIQVTSGKNLLDELAARQEVEQILADGAYQIPRPISEKPEPGPRVVEWNVVQINADDVWTRFGDTGQDIVVGSIDTGVEFTHEALVNQYRGNLGGGNFDHNYNWWDPSQICGPPGSPPCDNVFHGTHTMGTAVGGDGPGPFENDIGVAPGARWITAKGCEDFSCSFEALISSGEWMLAPTDLFGNNPRPDLRPHAVNNSWGGGPGDTFYQSIVQAWVASGIFPAFANGNAGPSCGSVGSPGDYSESFGVGATDINDDIAEFSGRGPSFFGPIKPEASAPGVDVRSSVPGNAYEFASGTSMATPHVVGTVALVWSAAPALIGDIPATFDLIKSTALDRIDDSCGGDPDGDPNNVYGDGRIDALAAVQAAPRIAGTLQGVVTDASYALPIASATVRAVRQDDGLFRATTTDPAGAYSMLLPVDPAPDPELYDATASAFGYLSETVTSLQIVQDTTTVQDFSLQPAPRFTVSGTVFDEAGNPIEGATVRVLGTPLPPALTGPDGAYTIWDVPQGEYDIQATFGRCTVPQIQHVAVVGVVTVDFTLPVREDAFGYRCQVIPFDWVDPEPVLPLEGDDNAVAVTLPFNFVLYGREYSTAFVATNGFLNFLALDARFFNGPVPDPTEPNAAVYPFWDDLVVLGGDSLVRTDTVGEAPERLWVLEYDNVAFFGDPSARVNFEVKLYERNGNIEFLYQSMPGLGDGSSATVGIEDADGSDAFMYAFNESVIHDGLAIRFFPPPSGFVQGQVTDAVDGAPLAGATVTALDAGRSTTTDANGFYRLNLPLGTQTLEASFSTYEPQRFAVEILLDQTITQDFALRSARAEIGPASLEFVVVQGNTATKSLTLRNSGLLDLIFDIGEVPVAAAAGQSVMGAPPSDSHTAPQGYTPVPATSVRAGGQVLVFMDLLPWGSSALTQVLDANDISYDQANSSEMATINMSPYEVVFLSNDQPQSFYDNYNNNRVRFEDYVVEGGFLWVGAAAWGWNGGDFNGGLLPGGAIVQGPVFEDFNDVLDNAHPTMQGVPDPFSGTFASHAAFQNLPAGTNEIARGQASGLPTLIEYDFGAGRVLAFGQPLEFGFDFGQDAGLILENAVPYAVAFEPMTDIPWLSEEPTSGTVPPNAFVEIRVTVDTTGLAPGFYKARLLFRTNDPHNLRLQVPVTLIVPAYRQAVNAGGGAYTDLAGEPWAADQRYAAGSWGYVQRSNTVSTRRAISGTEDDPLYQKARRGQVDYRFDGLAQGVYQVELRFAEIQNLAPGRRLFDVIVEGSLVLPAHDIAAEVGRFTANEHTFFIPVNDGQLNIRFIIRRSFGEPLINAIRVTHRPDR